VKDAAGHLLDAIGDAETMQRSQLKRAQNEEFERTLKKFRGLRMVVSAVYRRLASFL
jgi:hypothetical protein